MAILKSEFYKYHVENLREIEKALRATYSQGKDAIKKKDSQNILSGIIRNYALLIDIWTECRLKKCIYEDSAFSDDDIKTIKNRSTHLEKWKTCLKLAFCNRYGIPKSQHDFIKANFPDDLCWNRYTNIKNILGNDLDSVITLRNRLAHGCWIYMFNSQEDALNTELCKELNDETLYKLNQKYKLMKTLADIINNLVVSKPTFERDFDKLYQTFTTLKTELDNPKNNIKFESHLKNSYDQRPKP